ncbi:V-type proton ATPase subunit e 2-like [Halichondria panicea]|uniref:V-type proton ATPase subunit e 2-like n=1 Tax=Halichondria panicea TaxID=6063 RepID=UPI00312BC357
MSEEVEAGFNTSLYVAVPLVTGFWLIVAAVGLILPFFLKNNKNRGVIGVSIVLTAICCYTFWLLAFLTQLNPLMGPNVETNVAAHIRRAWGGLGDEDNSEYPCFPNW